MSITNKYKCFITRLRKSSTASVWGQTGLPKLVSTRGSLFNTNFDMSLCLDVDWSKFRKAYANFSLTPSHLFISHNGRHFRQRSFDSFAGNRKTDYRLVFSVICRRRTCSISQPRCVCITSAASFFLPLCLRKEKMRRRRA